MVRVWTFVNSVGFLFYKRSSNRRETVYTCTYTMYLIKPIIKKALRGNPLPCLTTMYDRSVIDDLYFDEAYNRYEDYIFWLTILKRGIVVKGNHDVLATCVIHFNSKNLDIFLYESCFLVLILINVLFLVISLETEVGSKSIIFAISFNDLC